jgi:hypothetical protein
MKNKIFRFTLLLSLTFFSCNEKNINITENDCNCDDPVNSITANIEVEYFLDDITIAENPFEMKEQKNNLIKHIMVVFEKPKTNETKKISINGFRSDDEYILWGEKRDIPIKEMLTKEKALAEFIAKNNIIEMSDETETIPEAFEQFETELFKANDKIASAIAIHKDCSGGASWLVANTIPSLKNTTWDNKISRYLDQAAYGGVSWYDSRWYKNKLTTTWNYGWQFICFTTHPALKSIDNKTTSLINW